MREFKNAKELLALCSEKDLPITEIMRQREIIIGEMQEQEKFQYPGSDHITHHLSPALPHGRSSRMAGDTRSSRTGL